MATDFFLQLETLEGETRDKEYAPKKASEIMSFSWGLAQAGSFHTGHGGGTGKASFHDISINKLIDKMSADLMLCCANGKHVKKGWIAARKAGEKPVEYFKISMEDIIVSSYTVQAGGTDIPVEGVSLNCAKIKVEYFSQNEKGTKEPGGQMSWDIAANAKE